MLVLFHSKDRSPSPVSDLPPTNTVPHQNISITSTSSGGSSNGRGVTGVSAATGFPITSHSSVSLSDGSYIQQSPKVRLRLESETICIFVQYKYRQKYTAVCLLVCSGNCNVTRKRVIQGNVFHGLIVKIASYIPKRKRVSDELGDRDLYNQFMVD